MLKDLPEYDKVTERLEPITENSTKTITNFFEECKGRLKVNLNHV